MHLIRSLRARTALVALSTGLLALGAAAAPAAAASQTVSFTLSTDKDVTTIVPCPAGTPANIALCGYAKDIAMSATNTANDKGLSGTVSESFVSALENPAPVPGCAAAMKTHSAVTIKTAKGDILMVTAGSFCTLTGQDVEPLTIVGGTGDYRGASGSGVINAQQTSPTSASETYRGTLKLAH